jgi:hypothetical protein
MAAASGVAVVQENVSNIRSGSVNSRQSLDSGNINGYYDYNRGAASKRVPDPVDPPGQRFPTAHSIPNRGVPT